MGEQHTFHQKSEGIWQLPSAGTSNQNPRTLIFFRYFQLESEGIYLSAGTFHIILRAITVYI
jgi:hypothetical protein